MSARDDLFALIAAIPGSGNADWCDKAREQLDAYAHELAEKQRAMQPDVPEGFTWTVAFHQGWVEGKLDAADLIDPAATDG